MNKQTNSVRLMPTKIISKGIAIITQRTLGISALQNDVTLVLLYFFIGAFNYLFKIMDKLEERLSKQRYLVGNHITEADWRIFTTLVHFDAVYLNHFKTNKQRLIDYKNIGSYTRELFHIPGKGETVNTDHIKYHYYRNHHSINPTGIIPKGPEINFLEAHYRENIS